MPTVTIQQAFDLALQHQRAGQLAEAEAIYRQILAVQPGHADSLRLLGVIAYRSGRDDLAENLIRQAIGFDPNNPAAHFNLGNLFRKQMQLERAIAAYSRAIEIQPDYADAHNNLGVAFKDRGQLDEAVTAYRRAIQLQPDFAEAHNNLGMVFQEQGRLEEAIDAYHQALVLQPGRGEIHSNLGNALQGQGRLDEAIAAYRRALELQPDYAGAHNNLGNALKSQHQLDAAVEAYRRALEIKPDYAKVCNNLGNTLKDQGLLDEAIASYRRAQEIAPQDARFQSNLIYALHLYPHTEPSAIEGAQAQWNRQFGVLSKRTERPYANDPDPERRLRIGYVSPDFRDHVAGRNVLPLFLNHDRRDYEILCYSGVTNADAFTDQFRQCMPPWRNTVGVADAALAEMIRQDGVDILMDLAQHSAGNRLPMFGHRPAPVQVSFVGYPESTGVDAIGYRISDHWMEVGKESIPGRERSPRRRRGIEAGWLMGEPSAPSLPAEPPEIGERSASVPYLEKTTETVFLLDSFWCYDPCGMDVAVNALPAQESGWIAFGCLNSFCKVNDMMLGLWARVMKAVPDSRLAVLSAFGSHRQRTMDFLASEGVAAERVEFVAPCGRRGYLERYHRLDVVLDTFPYNGHTTSLDALWMGVPVVSLAGKTAVSRAGLSQLSNLGLPELVAHSEDEYVEIAARLAGDLPRLAELRRTLRGRMEASVLMDAPHFARQIEAAYRTMWRRWCAESAVAER